MLGKTLCPHCRRVVHLALCGPQPGDLHICDGCGAITQRGADLHLAPLPPAAKARPAPWLLRTQHLIRTDRDNMSRENASLA